MTREEVVIDKELVDQPTTVMKPVVTEKPKIFEKPKFVATLEERLQKVMVVRPQVHEERVRTPSPSTATPVPALDCQHACRLAVPLGVA